MSIRALIAVTLAASAVASFAGAGSPGAPAGRGNPGAAPGPNTAEKLVATYDATGNGSGTSLPQFAFTTVATSTVKCKAACSIGIESSAQIQTASGDWAICLLIDGVDVSCQFQGIQSGPSSYVMGNARGWGTGLSAGTHTVATQIYAEGAGATYEYFQTDARVYKP